MNKISKAGTNKKIATILNRHRVDRSLIKVSVTSSTINLYGTLLRLDGEDFSSEAMLSMAEEITRFGRIMSNLTNWDLNGGIRKIDQEHY